MANAHMPDEFFDLVGHHLPPERPVGPRGGRPRVGNQVVVNVLWFVLATGNRWEDVPPRMGCPGRTAHRRASDREAGMWDRLHADLIRLLGGAGKLDADVVVVDSVIVRAFGGGEKTGPSPRGPGQAGHERHPGGGPQRRAAVIRTAGANVSDHRQVMPVVAEFPEPAGEDEGLPGELYADRGFGSDLTRSILRRPGTEPHVGKRGTPHRSGSSKVRWVVERTISWLKGLRRMRVR